MEKAAELLKGLSQNGFRWCFEGWKADIYMEQCVLSNGNYFEGHNMKNFILLATTHFSEWVHFRVI